MNAGTDKSYGGFQIRNANHVNQTAAESAFNTASGNIQKFVVQRVDRYDYGTDFQIEAKAVAARQVLAIACCCWSFSLVMIRSFAFPLPVKWFGFDSASL